MNTFVVSALAFVLCGYAMTGLAADSGGVSDLPVPLFHYRTLQHFLRKDPVNTFERVAAGLKSIVPDDIKPWVVLSPDMSMNYNYRNGDTPREFAQRLDAHGYRFLVEIGDPSGTDASRRTFYGPDLEAIFAACPNCLGVDTGETFWAFTGGDNPKYDHWLIEVLRVCARNHRYFFLGEGTWNKGHWTRFFARHYAELAGEKLGTWLVAAHKNTKPWATLENVNALQGAWITGTIGHFAIWNDPWTWTYSSFGDANEFPAYRKGDHNERKVPYTFFLRQWLWGISVGADVCSTEEPMTFDREGRPNSSFGKYLHPFIRGIAAHRIVPSRAAVLAKTRAMVDPFGVYPTRRGPWTYDPRTIFFTYLDEATAFAPKSYDPFTVLFRNTYGFDRADTGTDAAGRMFAKEPSLPNRLIREVLPNTARYYGLPILPDPAAPVPPGMPTVKLNQLRTDAAVQQVFDALYPADPGGSEAYAVEVDDSFFVINGSENRDQDQAFRLPLGSGEVQSMEGKIPFQNLIFGKREGRDRYWFQANGYHGDGVTRGQMYACVPKPTVITFACARPPGVAVESGNPARLQIFRPWDAQTRTLTLCCDHTDGAVSFYLQAGRP